MGALRRYPDEVRERAVRLVFEWREARGRTNGGLEEIAAKIGVHRESLRNWVRQAQVDAGVRPGRSTDDRERIKELERENFELRRANEILKSAAAFFGAELDRQPRR